MRVRTFCPALPSSKGLLSVRTQFLTLCLSAHVYLRVSRVCARGCACLFRLRVCHLLQTHPLRAENKPSHREGGRQRLVTADHVGRGLFNPPWTLNIGLCLKSQLSFLSPLQYKLQLTDPLYKQVTADLRGFTKKQQENKNQSRLPKHPQKKALKSFLIMITRDQKFKFPFVSFQDASS